MNKISEPLQKQALEQHETTGQPKRLFGACWYRAKGWPAQRWVILKAEAHSQGTNRRAIITNRPGAFVLPAAAYDAYADRGESENRNKELKCGLQADRLSDHRYVANARGRTNFPKKLWLPEPTNKILAFRDVDT